MCRFLWVFLITRSITENTETKFDVAAVKLMQRISTYVCNSKNLPTPILLQCMYIHPHIGKTDTRYKYELLLITSTGFRYGAKYFFDISLLILTVSSGYRNWFSMVRYFSYIRPWCIQSWNFCSIDRNGFLLQFLPPAAEMVPFFSVDAFILIHAYGFPDKAFENSTKLVKLRHHIATNAVRKMLRRTEEVLLGEVVY